MLELGMTKPLFFLLTSNKWFWNYFAADSLARLGHNLDNGQQWTNSIPGQASRTILFYVVNAGFNIIPYL